MKYRVLLDGVEYELVQQAHDKTLFRMLPAAPLDKSHPDYLAGWKAGFKGLPITDTQRSSEWFVGQEAGDKLRDYLDGYFFWDRNLDDISR